MADRTFITLKQYEKLRTQFEHKRFVFIECPNCKGCFDEDGCEVCDNTGDVYEEFALDRDEIGGVIYPF